MFISVGIFLPAEFLDHRIYIWASSECPAKKLSKVLDANLYSDEPWMRTSSTLCCYCLLAKVVSDSVTPWTEPLQASLPYPISQNFFKYMSIESVMTSNHLILCHPLLLPSIFSSIRVFSNELALHIRWPKYWSFSFSISPSNEYSGLISFRPGPHPKGPQL